MNSEEPLITCCAYAFVLSHRLKLPKALTRQSSTNNTHPELLHKQTQKVTLALGASQLSSPSSGHGSTLGGVFPQVEVCFGSHMQKKDKLTEM